MNLIKYCSLDYRYEDDVFLCVLAYIGVLGSM
jgi:hypothetical protein